MKTATRLIALPLLLVAAFAVNAYAASYFAGSLFPAITPRPYFEMISAAVVGSLAASAPVVTLRVGDLLHLSHYAGTDESQILVMSSVEGLACPIAILVGVWLVSLRASRENAA